MSGKRGLSASLIHRTRNGGTIVLNSTSPLFDGRPVHHAPRHRTDPAPWVLTGTNLHFAATSLRIDHPAAHNGAVYCSNCGAENQPGGTYCIACGKMLNP